MALPWKLPSSPMASSVGLSVILESYTFPISSRWTVPFTDPRSFSAVVSNRTVSFDFPRFEIVSRTTSLWAFGRSGAV